MVIELFLLLLYQVKVKLVLLLLFSSLFLIRGESEIMILEFFSSYLSEVLATVIGYPVI